MPDTTASRHLTANLARSTHQSPQSGYGNAAVAAALYLGRNYSYRTLRQLGEGAGGMKYPAVTMSLRRFAKRLQSDKALAKKLKRLKEMLLVKTLS